MSRLAGQGNLKRRNDSVLRWVTVCLLPLTGLSSLRAEDSSLRTGLWVVQKLPGDESALQEFAKNVNASRALAGVCLHIPWSAIEKSPGQPDFDTLDKAVAVLHGKAMKYQLCLKPGADTPAFVYSQGAQSFSTTITNLHRPNAGAVVTIPIPWDPIYQRDFSQLIAQLGSRYSSDPLCVSVVLTCANFLSAEMHLPKTQSDLGKWAALGNYNEKLFDTYGRFTDEWARSFPRQEISLHLSKVLNLPASFCKRVIDFGLSKYPERFTIQNCQLTGRREDTGMMTYDLVQEYSTRAHHGFQSVASLSRPNDRMGSMEMAALNVVHAKGSYWELWHGDGFDPKTCEAISRTWEEARGLGYDGYKRLLVSEGKYRH